MGTSKGYIAPTRPEWSKAKRAISAYLRIMDTDSLANAVSKYAEAMLTEKTNSTDCTTYGSSFSSAVGSFLTFAQGVAEKGLDETLKQLGRDDLIGKPSETIIQELLEQFTNHSSTVEDALASQALSTAFEVLEIESPDDLAKIDLDTFLLELIIAFVNNDFDLRFNEKINRGRTPKETLDILKDVHGYIDGTLRNKLNHKEISKINLSEMSAEKIVSAMLDEAFSVCKEFYGVEA